MRNEDDKKMGRFFVDVEIVNNRDLAVALAGQLDPAKVRRKTIRALVDSGATLMVLPQAVAKELGLPAKKNKVKVRYADGRRGLRVEVDDVRVYLLGRDAAFSAIVEPKRDTALLGAVVLETLDLLVDCNNQHLVRRDPDHVLSEIGW
jgi:clan AA aspartic protease